MELLTSHYALFKGEHYAPLNGVIIRYIVSGQGPVCLCPTPGWGPSLVMYKNSLHPLEEYFTMVYYDTRMSGRSSGPEDPMKYTSEDFMKDMDALRNYLQQEKIWLMGHSSGAYQALNYGIHHNDNLNGIIAISAIAGRDSLSGEELKNNILKRAAKPRQQRGAAIFLGNDTTNYTLNEQVRLSLPLYFHDQDNLAVFAEKTGVLELSEKAFRYTNASKNGSELLFPLLHKITVSALIVVGDDDFICDKISQSDRIHEQIASSTLLVIKNAGHYCWIEQPEQFFEGCRAWIKEQEKLSYN
ncbi:Pimeloyl-ACP methyl ester carboxylesterase [Pedobacter westerhofensis]|uniref:Pimeloyl-ACP methyl ester carboxylesterase n=1 Tax=Pedobacter westerhofensis TaxID=425512 RepID=A0A521BAX2_9SPHI|nr:alpha/beta hydrolase [Pedobacter westerhofensis]SMO44236.1 Pimeloyl-ACP methyl ester carboxylesterase [Pedobacter westerhofensis]